MTYYIESFRRDDTGVDHAPYCGRLESETRKGLSLEVSEYFEVSMDSLEYSGPEVIVTVFEDDYGFRVDTKEEGKVVELVGTLKYEGKIDWQDAERAITITGSESNR